jgi:hypothetical protein
MLCARKYRSHIKCATSCRLLRRAMLIQTRRVSSFDQLRPPERASERGARQYQLFHWCARNLGDLRWRQRCDGVLHPVQYRRVRVAAIARHEECRDLARPFRKHLVTAGPAGENYEYRPRLIALADQIMTRGKVPQAASRSPTSKADKGACPLSFSMKGLDTFPLREGYIRSWRRSSASKRAMLRCCFYIPL